MVIDFAIEIINILDERVIILDVHNDDVEEEKHDSWHKESWHQNVGAFSDEIDSKAPEYGSHVADDTKDKVLVNLTR